MGVVEAKLAVKKDDATSSHPPRPSNSFMEAVNGELASLKLQEKPADGVGAPEIAAPDDDDDHHKDPESPNKGEEEAEKVVWPRLPQRPDEPDCAYYTKTGTCKFGLNCKFNHPPKRRRHRAKSKKQPEDVQAAKEECEGSGSKMMGQTTHTVDEKERKVLQKSFRHENVQEKQKGTLLKKVEQNEKKAVEEQTRIPSKRMEQEDYKAKSKRQWKAAQAIKEEHEESRSKMVVQTACKVDENEKEIVHSVMQLKFEAAEEKQILPKRMEQEDNKAVEEKQMLSERMEHQDNKAAKEKGKETTSGKAAPTECKFYTMPGGCKFGKSCKYVHPQKKIEVGSVELNFLGLPIRPGEKECSYYMRTGNCKFATNCKYHHPDPTVAIGGQDPFPVPQSRGSMQQIAFEASPLPVTPFPTQGTFNGPTSFIVASPSYSPGSNLHSQGFHSTPECNGYQVHIDEYPERPGQPECQYFLRNGVCKFRSACKFHHPKAHLPAKSIGTFIPSYPPQ